MTNPWISRKKGTKTGPAWGLTKGRRIERERGEEKRNRNWKNREVLNTVETVGERQSEKENEREKQAEGDRQN